MTFLPGNEKLTIRQEFKGIDEHDHLAVSTTLEGRVPEVPPGSTVQIDRYSEIYQYSNNCKIQLKQHVTVFILLFLCTWKNLKSQFNTSEVKTEKLCYLHANSTFQ